MAYREGIVRSLPATSCSLQASTPKKIIAARQKTTTAGATLKVTSIVILSGIIVPPWFGLTKHQEGQIDMLCPTCYLDHTRGAAEGYVRPAHDDQHGCDYALLARRKRVDLVWILLWHFVPPWFGCDLRTVTRRSQGGQFDRIARWAIRSESQIGFRSPSLSGRLRLPRRARSSQSRARDPAWVRVCPGA